MSLPFARSELTADNEGKATRRVGPAALNRRVNEMREHYACVAPQRADYIQRNAYYYNQIFRALRFIIPPGKRVLQVGCLTPDFLDALSPSVGLGIDLCAKVVDVCSQRFPHLQFCVHEDYNISHQGTFDYVLITDINDQVDPIAALRTLASAMHEHTRVIVQNYNHLWEPIIQVAERCGLKFPLPQQNWLSSGDVANILTLCDYEPLQVHHTVLIPKKLPLLSWLVNALFARLPLVRHLNMIELTVARPLPRRITPQDYSVSIVVPCRNEVGNIAAAVERIPNLGRHTEIIFCDDKSTDGTADEVRRMQRLYPHRDIKLLDGPGVCKALNVRTGFDHAQGDILMILDADLTTMPEELGYFYDVIAGRKAEFVNGSRFIFPMEGEAMRTLNIVGNRFFSAVFSFLLGQPVTDTLCGTKVMWRHHWPAIRALAGSWGADDRWGDYDLLFGAAKLHLSLIDVPVHYQERFSGETKMIGRFRNGMIMLRMCWVAFLKFKLY